jgi:hypothetical protein
METINAVKNDSKYGFQANKLNRGHTVKILQHLFVTLSTTSSVLSINSMSIFYSFRCKAKAVPQHTYGGAGGEDI